MARDAGDVRRWRHALNGCQDHSACAGSRRSAHTGRTTCGTSASAFVEAGAFVDVDLINCTNCSRAAQRKREDFVSGRCSTSEHLSHFTESHSSTFQRSERKTIHPNCAQDSACRYTTSGAGDDGSKFNAHGG
jgi:hypothetical protein